MMAVWREAVARLLLPNACVVCGTPGNPAAADHTGLLCPLCRSRLVPVTPGCARCAQPLPPIGPCRFCCDWDQLDQVRSAVWLEEGARQAVHALKYGGIHAMTEPMTDVILRCAAPMAGTLIPIPLGSRRLRLRGYNQAAALAASLARRWRVTMRPDVVVRCRETRTQTELTPDERRVNVAGAFQAVETGRGAVILVDDVLTTGATLLAAAAALRAAGWGPVRALTFARAEPWGRRIAG